ncbi:MAG TPA: hypothetical protein EYQ00_00910, partial [Dehalococcoidia bacterium]|nr:hypothetical protein [Dehalococcoidia bacterium]
MSTPIEVMSQATEADKLIDELSKGNISESENPVEEPITDDAVTARDVISEVTTPEAEEPEVNKENDPQYWKQRFQVVQGLLNQKNEGSDDRVADLERQNESLTNRINA